MPHVHDRVEIWLDPYDDPQDSGYQILQSIFAQADGGLFGKGFGQALITIPGTDDALLPAAQTDTIYSLIVNEVGLFGACGVILIYLLVAARGFKIALLADDGFSKLLATGLTAVFAIQAFVIIGGVTRVIPLTGVTLPFISYGGSSIVANFVLLALLLLISDRARREAPNRRADGDWEPREPPDRQALRLHRRPLRGPGRLHVLLVGLRRRGAEGKGREQAAAARAAADPPRPDPRRRRHRDRPLGRRRARATRCATCGATRKARSSATRSATASCSQGDTEFEQFHNDELVGEESEFSSILDELRGRTQEGNDIVTNIDPEAQRIALRRPRGSRASAPSSRSSPSTGAVKVMASNAPYDPNRVPYELEKLNTQRNRNAAARTGRPRATTRRARPSRW